MPSAPAPAFELPDTIAALPVRPFEFSERARAEAGAIVAQPADECSAGVLHILVSCYVLVPLRDRPAGSPPGAA